MKILLLDTAFAAAPIYKALLNAGNDVWVMGNRSTDLLARVAHERWIDQNYSEVDKVREHAERLGIERVIPGCTDISIETCLQLPQGSHLRDSVEINQELAHKRSFRKLCEHLDLPAPRVLDPGTFPRLGKYICKPVDAFSGRGISVFNGEDLDALAAAISVAQAASRTGAMLIETYVGDDLYSCSGFLQNFAFTDIFFVREGTSANPYAVDTSYVVDELPLRAKEVLISSLEKLARHLRLKDGLLHAQFILSDIGPAIIEVARRCPGDLYPILIEYSTGFQYAAKFAACLAGYNYSTQVTKRRHVLRHTLSADWRMDFSGLDCNEPIPLLAFFPLAPLGEPLLPAQGNRAGIVFAEYATTAALHDAFSSFMSRRVYCLGT
jgi:hypothetical protein